MRCSFCATGAGGFARNLAPHEIVDQVLTVQEAFSQRVSNVGTLAVPLRPYNILIPTFVRITSYTALANAINNNVCSH